MPLLEIKNLTVEFKDPETGRINRACDGVSFSINEAEIVGLVGESGCGKSTLGRAIVGLETLSLGSIVYRGIDITLLRPAEQRKSRREVQYIFQDSLAALEPRQTIGEALTEALVIRGERNVKAQAARISEVISATNLPAGILPRRPSELSGGQRQRVCIARALLADPKVLICDEPVSSLDTSLKAQVMNEFLRLRDELGVAIVLIAHDLAVVRQASSRVNVMYLGRIVESGPSEALYREPWHPYTQALTSAILGVNPMQERSKQRTILKGDLPSPFAMPVGCKFLSRCSKAHEICSTATPAPHMTGERNVECYLYGN